MIMGTTKVLHFLSLFPEINFEDHFRKKAKWSVSTEHNSIYIADDSLKYNYLKEFL